MKNIVFLEAGNLGSDMDLERFQKLGNVTIYEQTSYEELPKRVKDAEVLVLNKIRMNEETLSKADKLKLICVTATGTNNIDFDYMKKRGIEVRNAAGYSTETVVQHTFAMLFYLFEHLAYYDRYVKEGSYMASESFTHFARSFHDLSAMTYGVVGLGNIGRKVAETAKAFGARVIYYSTSGTHEDKEFERVGFSELLKESDIISVHAPLNEDTCHLFDAAAFRQMKPTAYFLNLGRGPIVEEQGLSEALTNGWIAGAGLDVLSEEPMKEDNPLYQIKDSDRLLITPHIAWASVEARTRLMDIVYENIRGFVEVPKRPPFIVFEGIDGSGKGTQIKLLAERLEKNGNKVFQTMEPSPLPAGKLLRQVLTGEVVADGSVIAPLFVADRLDHIQNEKEGMLGKLLEGYTVLCDRYYFSSYAYQGMQVSMDWVMELNRPCAGLLRPDVTIFLDIDEENAMERILNNRTQVELFEKKETLRKVRENYMEAFHRCGDKENVLIVDGKKSVEEISEIIWEYVEKHLLKM